MLDRYGTTGEPTGMPCENASAYGVVDVDLLLQQDLSVGQRHPQDLRRLGLDVDFGIQPTRIAMAMERASFRSVFTGMIFVSARSLGGSMQIAFKPASLSPSCSHREILPTKPISGLDETVMNKAALAS